MAASFEGEEQPAADILDDTPATTSTSTAQAVTLVSESDKEAMRVIRAEIETIKSAIPAERVVSAYPQLIQIKIQLTRYKRIVMDMQFPSTYPASPLLLDFRSKMLDAEVVGKLQAAAEAEAAKNTGGTQVLLVYNLIDSLMNYNMLLPCYDELGAVREAIAASESEVDMTASEKSGRIKLKMARGQYRLNATVTVPTEYPDESPTVDIPSTNFLDSYKTMFLHHCRELIRQSKDGPLGYSVGKNAGRVWLPVPCVADVLLYLISDCIDSFPVECCQLCEERVFPDNPAEVDPAPSKDRRIERVYCGHLFHHSCLDTFISTPPFENGKACPSCKKRIYHRDWTNDGKLLEARWAHKQAQVREVGEVTEFLGINDFAAEIEEEKSPEWLAARIAEQQAAAAAEAGPVKSTKKKKKKVKLKSGGGVGNDDMSAFL